MKTKKDSLTKKSTGCIYSINKSLSNPNIPLEKTENFPSLRSKFKVFENLRSNLLQWHLLNAEMKERIKNQSIKQEVEKDKL